MIDNTIRLMPIRTQSQLADILTKPLPRAKILPIVSKMKLQTIFAAAPS